MAIVEKKSKDGKRVYLYEQKSVRVNGKVTTPTKYLGPKYPKRRRGLIRQMLAGGAVVAAHAAIGKLPALKTYKDNSTPYSREQRLLDDKFRALGHKWAVADKDPSPQGRKTGHFASKEAADHYNAERNRIMQNHEASMRSPAESAALKAHQEEANASSRSWKADNAKWAAEQPAVAAAELPANDTTAGEAPEE